MPLRPLVPGPDWMSVFEVVHLGVDPAVFVVLSKDLPPALDQVGSHPTAGWSWRPTQPGRSAKGACLEKFLRGCLGKCGACPKKKSSRAFANFFPTYDWFVGFNFPFIEDLAIQKSSQPTSWHALGWPLRSISRETSPPPAEDGWGPAVRRVEPQSGFGSVLWLIHGRALPVAPANAHPCTSHTLVGRWSPVCNLLGGRWRNTACKQWESWESSRADGEETSHLRAFNPELSGRSEPKEKSGCR